MSEPKPTTAMLKVRGVYRRWLERRYGRITLAGLAPDDEPLLLRQIYVPLKLADQRLLDSADETQLENQGKELEDWLLSLEEPSGEEVSEEVLYSSPAWRVKKTRTLLISGEPGSGKTTLTQSVIASLSGSVPDEFNRWFEGCIPIPIPLRSVPSSALGKLEKLVAWCFKEVQKESKEPFDAEALREFLDRGWGIFLFDGLDELGSMQQRKRFLKALRDHRWLEGEDANLALLTGRPSGYEGVEKVLPPGLRLHVMPFSKEQIGSYLKKWFALRPMRSGERDRAAQSLLERLTSQQETERLLPMARRPAYLAALAFVHGTRGQLPHTRAELYALLVDAYLEVLDQYKDQSRHPGSQAEEDRRNWSRQDKLQVLSMVAFIAHEGATEGSSRKKSEKEDRRFQWTKEDLVKTVRQAIEVGGERLRDAEIRDAKELTDYFVARTGLLAETAEGVYQFAHLSFQEYLAAIYLLDEASADPDKAGVIDSELLQTRLQRDGWQEVGLLLLAADALRTQNTGHRAVLAKLDLANEAQFELLTQVLAGGEVRLGESERRYWVVVWYAYAAAFDRPDGIERLARNSANLPWLILAWQAWAEALAKERGLVEVVSEAAGPAPSSGGGRQRGLLGAASKGEASSSGGPQSGVEALRARLENEDCWAAALALPLNLHEPPLKEVSNVLGQIADRHPLFQGAIVGPEVWDPRPLYWVVEAWSLREAAVASWLNESIPLPRLADDPLAGDRALWSKAESPRSRWQKELLSQYFLVDLAASALGGQREGHSSGPDLGRLLLERWPALEQQAT
ncbi:MAG: NACHT domain-containing protein, partial [Acidobacteriota bacterium]|nr:NACHT domain-containing protein [Acidobacteriota bacterium]